MVVIGVQKKDKFSETSDILDYRLVNKERLIGRCGPVPSTTHVSHTRPREFGYTTYINTVVSCLQDARVLL